jgi:TonB family protein
LLAELHAKIRAEKPGSDAMFHQIVEAAQILTCAHGAAIAMRQDGSVFCMARTGGMAPALGSELQVDSGISGQCLRTGAPLCCDDTGTDARVDPEVCRRLGLRSLAVAPVGKWPAVNGVLEVFSATPCAFKDAEVQLLAELADLVEVLLTTRALSTVLDASEKVVTPQTRTTSSVLSAGIKLARATRKWSNGKVVLAVIFMFIIWLGLRGRAARPNASAAPPQPRSTLGASSVPASVPASSADVAEKPTTLPANGPSPVVDRNTRASVPDGALMASTSEKTRPTEPVIPEKPKSEAASVENAPAPAANLASPPSQPTVDVASAPPLDVVSANSNAELKGILSPVTASPVLPVRQSSTDISGGTIERFVQPTYPPEALRLKRTGRVVLQAVITKEGTVHDLKVIDGDLLLTRAAMDAVAQWRYRPYLLNGQPIQKTTKITIVFNLP